MMFVAGSAAGMDTGAYRLASVPRTLKNQIAGPIDISPRTHIFIGSVVLLAVVALLSQQVLGELNQLVRSM